MAMNAPSAPGGSGGGISQFVEDNPTIALGGGIILIVIIGALILRKNTTAASGTSGQDLSGLTTDAYGNKIAYVPTATSFTTTNYQSNSGNSSTTTDNSVKSTPVAAPARAALYWNQKYMFKPGENLAGLAYNVTKAIKAHGAPPSLTITWQQIYQYNQATLDGLAKQYGYKSTNISSMKMRGGEAVTIPQWITA